MMQDDDDLALSHMIRSYMYVASRTGAQVLTDISDNYDSRQGHMKLSHRSLAIGNAFAHNFFVNDFGKANFCVTPKPALDIGGHHSNDYGNSPYVDWGFLTRASLHRLHMELLPMVLYKYAKQSKGSIWYGRTSVTDKYTGHYKMIEDSQQYVPDEFRDILLYCRYRLGVPQILGDGPL
jgi:hypothetical protein